MNVTRASQAPAYAAPGHHDIGTVRLQGHEAGHTDRFWVGLSRYQPGGQVDKSPTRGQTVYVVLDGELVITCGDTETALGRLDSIHLAKGEVRLIQNRSDREALLLVTIAHSRGKAP